ncbi:hypothetical protein BX264_6036 [Streptomyces sp. 2333.5]|nr:MULTISPECIES: hypothetical protein [unclassified Streptomyces]PJJ05569.1 hypothetical protein BX264_6036 [Streptomyces sp. 2333.5]SEE79310.1 hypothetical protein SAMN05428943_6134 [Streptomyces sp. 2314.4]SEF01035.1 hypothetical protein SAMN05428942_6134 [Streptomyces sp. 2112.2]
MSGARARWGGRPTAHGAVRGLPQAWRRLIAQQLGGVVADGPRLRL